MLGLPRQIATLALVVTLGTALGCGERDRYSDASVELDKLASSGEAGAGWQSAPLPTTATCDPEVDGGMLTSWTKLGGRRKLELEHGLGRAPVLVLSYIAYKESGCGGTLASGDVVSILGVDDRRLILQNATKEQFFLRVFLQ